MTNANKYVRVGSAEDEFGPRGAKAKVNWFRDGKMGVTFVEGSATGASNVFREDEVTWIRGPADATRKKLNLNELSIDELRERLKKVRRERRALAQGREEGAKGSPQKRKRSTKKRISAEEAVANLSEEEKKMLLEMMQPRGDDES